MTSADGQGEKILFEARYRKGMRILAWILPFIILQPAIGLLAGVEGSTAKAIGTVFLILAFCSLHIPFGARRRRLIMRLTTLLRTHAGHCARR